MKIKLSAALQQLNEILKAIDEGNEQLKAIKNLLKLCRTPIERDLRLGTVSNDTELTEEASIQFADMLQKAHSFKDKSTDKKKGQEALASVKRFYGIPVPYPTQAPSDANLDRTTASSSAPSGSAPAARGSAPAADHSTDQEKLVKVKAHLQRWAAVEQYASAAKKIGYGDHLRWLEENEKLVTKDPTDKKAQLIVDAYIAMPGFGGQPDKHEFVDLHMEIELLELELIKLKKEELEKMTTEEGEILKETIKNKEAGIKTNKEKLKQMLNAEAGKISERLENEIKKNPELEPYLRPVVDSYITWLVRMEKFGRMPQLCVLDGPPGTGKTYIAQTLANTLGIDLQQIPMSSESDTTLIPGRNKGWEDPNPGRVAELQKASKSQLFLFFSDELEKAEKPVINTHVDLFESGQVCYKDKFFNNLNVPKLFTACVATTNDFDILPGHIKSRSKKIIVSGKKPEEKLGVIKRRLQTEINSITVLQDKTIKFEPNEDELLLWFLKTYSTQPGYREDNQNVDKIVAELTKHFIKNNKETEFTVNRKFITEILGIPSARHAEKRRLWDTYVTIGKELDKHNEALKLACNKDGAVTNREGANKALGQQIVFRGLMRSNIQSLISNLEQELRDTPDNKALLQPEIDRLRNELNTFKELTPLQIEFLSDNLANIDDYNLTPKSLTELINDHLTKLGTQIDATDKEILQIKFGSEPGKYDEAQKKLTGYKEEQAILQNLLKKMNLKEKAGEVRDKKTESDIPPGSRSSSPSSSSTSPTGSSSTPSTPSESSTSSSRSALSARGPTSTADRTPSSSATGAAKVSVRKGALFFKHGVSRAIREYNPTITIPASQELSSEAFKVVVKSLQNEVKNLKEQSERAPLLDDTDSFKNLEFGPLKTEDGVESVSVTRGVSDVMTIRKLEKSVEIEAANRTPKDDELYAMVHAAKIAAEQIGRKRFIIEHCEEDPKTAFKLYLIGKSMGLTPTFKDPPGQTDATLKAITEGEYGKQTLSAGESAAKSIADIFKEVRSGSLSQSELQKYIAELEHPDTPSSGPSSPTRT